MADDIVMKYARLVDERDAARREVEALETQLSAEEGLVAEARREVESLRGLLGDSLKALREYHPNAHDSPPRPHCPACKVLGRAAEALRKP